MPAKIYEFPAVDNRDAKKFEWVDGEYFIVEAKHLDPATISRIICTLAVYENQLRGISKPGYFDR